MTAVTTTVTYRRTGTDEDLTGYIRVADGITIRSGKAQAFGTTEITTCEFRANRTIMQSDAWKVVTRDTANDDIQVVVNGSTRFTGWWWRTEEDVFDETGTIRVILASTGLRSIIEDTRKLRYGTRALPGTSDAAMFLGIDPGLLDLNQVVDSELSFSATAGPVSDDPSFQKAILDPPNSIPQLESGARNVYAVDTKFRALPGSSISPPFTVSFTANKSPQATAASSTVKLVGVYTDTYSVHIYNNSSGNVWCIVRNEVTDTAFVNTTVNYATRNSSQGEIWHFNINVIESGGNVQTVIMCRPMSRAEGKAGDLPGVVLVNDTTATPAGGVGAIKKIEFGPSAAGLDTVSDSIVSDILVRDDASAGDGASEFKAALGGLALTSLTATWVPYYGLTSQLNAGTYTPPTPVIPPGSGADQLACIEEVHRTVVRDSRTADLTTIRGGIDYVPTQITELELQDDYLRGSGSSGEEGVLDVLVPDANYLATHDPYGAQWVRNRPRRWVRLPVNLTSANKRDVRVGESLVSFWTPVKTLFRGRVVGIEETITPALHTAFWLLEEWYSEAQIVTDTAKARTSDGSALAARVNATWSSSSPASLTVDATYSYSVPFTVRPANQSKYYLIIGAISGTTWTVSGSSFYPPSLAVGDLLNFDTPGVAW